jgi:hypothetical protein
MTIILFYGAAEIALVAFGCVIPNAVEMNINMKASDAHHWRWNVIFIALFLVISIFTPPGKYRD